MTAGEAIAAVGHVLLVAAGCHVGVEEPMRARLQQWLDPGTGPRRTLGATASRGDVELVTADSCAARAAADAASREREPMV